MKKIVTLLCLTVVTFQVISCKQKEAKKESRGLLVVKFFAMTWGKKTKPAPDCKEGASLYVCSSFESS